MFKKILDWLIPAFDVTTSGGASARKLSAFWFVMVVTILEFIYTIKCLRSDKELVYLLDMIWADLIFAATALGFTLVKGTTANNKKDETPPVDEKPIS